MKYFYFILLSIIVMISGYGFLSAQIHLNTAIELYKNKEYEKAKAYLLEEYKTDNKNAEVNFYLGCCYLMLKDHDKAIDYFENAVEIEETNAEYHYKLGEALGIKAQHSNVIKQAWMASRIKKEFEKALELDSTHLGARIACISFYTQAPSVMGGDLDKAKKSIKGLPPSQHRMAESLSLDIDMKEGNNKLAAKKFAELDSTFNDSTDHYSFYNKYGYFLLNQKLYDKAIIMFKRQVTLAPDEANPYDSLGDGYRAAGKYAEAIAQYKIAIELDPEMEISRKKMKEIQDK